MLIVAQPTDIGREDTSTEESSPRPKRRGRPPKPLTENDSRHGTASAYRNYGCRCAPCTAANTEMARAYRAGVAK